jgi:glycosyltransferase involved in cell wall biosynthesis
MRILYLCADPGVPIMGRKGCSTHVREIARALSRAGHECQIACGARGTDEDVLADLDIIEIPPLTSSYLGFDLRAILYNLRFDRALKRIITKFPPDAIYERLSLYSFSGGKLAKRLRVPRLLEVNAFLSFEQRDRIHFPRLARKADNAIVRGADQVIVVSEPLRNDVAALGVARSRIHKMPMSADVTHFTPEKSGGEIRKHHGFEGKYVIGYVGTLTGWHGINLLYDVARHLEKEIDNFIFFLVGGDEHKVLHHRRKACELGLDSRFVFAGSVPYNQVPEHVRAMDVTLVPDTTYWSSPTKLFEYQAAGVPTVAPRYAAITEAMEEGNEGLLFDAGNVDQLAGCLLELARDPQRRREMGANARKRVVTSHSVDRQVGRLVDLLEQMRRGEPPHLAD